MATLAELQTLIGDPNLKDKVRASVVIAAKNVAFEDTQTANHANRLKWSKGVLNDPNGAAEKLTRFIVGYDATQSVAEIQGLSDADINNRVAAGINIFADGT